MPRNLYGRPVATSGNAEQKETDTDQDARDIALSLRCDDLVLRADGLESTTKHITSDDTKTIFATPVCTTSIISTEQQNETDGVFISRTTTALENNDITLLASKSKARTKHAEIIPVIIGRGYVKQCM